MKVNDLVVWRLAQGYSSTSHRGKIVKITPGGTVTVLDLSSNQERVFKKNARGFYPHDFRLMSPSELALRAWTRAAPKMHEVQVKRSWSDDNVFTVEYTAHTTTTGPAALRAAAAELEVFATWLEARPKGDK